VGVQAAPAAHQPVEELHEGRPVVPAIGAATQADPAVQVPAEQQDRALGALERVGERAEVALGVHQHGDPLGPGQPPARVALHQHRARCPLDVLHPPRLAPHRGRASGLRRAAGVR